MKYITKFDNYDDIWLIDTDVYFKYIYESFKKNVANIKKQFELDFNRSTYTINNKKITHINDIYNKLKIFDKYILNDITLFDNLLMLLNQSSLADIYVLMQSLINDNNYVLCSTNIIYNIHIDNTNHKIIISIVCHFNLKYIKNGNIIKKYIISNNFEFIYNSSLTYHYSKNCLLFIN